MILYNVTVNLAPELEQDWLQWVQKEHIPAMLATQKFVSAQLVKVYDEEQMATGSYAVQYKAENAMLLNAYLKEDAPRLRQQTKKRFGDQLIAFRTFLNILAEHK
jgi:hypothetical protein